MKEKIVLKNNVTVIHDCNPGLHTAAISVFFKCGSIFETLSNQGISHMTEHMFFRRLYDLPQDELYFRTELIGSFLHGKTSWDCVSFDMNCSPKYYKRAFEIISRTLYKFNWSESEFEKEKEVVKRQIDFKGFSLERFCDEKYLKHTKYEFPIMGTSESLEKLTVKKINLWKEKYFTCDNCCVVFTGNFSDNDLKYALRRLENIENKGESFSLPKLYPKNIFNRTSAEDIIFADDSDVSDVFVYFDIDTKIFNINQCVLIMNMLCKGDGSRLIYLLRDKLGIAENIDSWLTLYSGFVRIAITYSVKGENLIKSLEEMFSEIENFKERITARDFQSTITYFTDNVAFEFDDPKGLGFNYGWQEFVLGINYDLDEKVNYNKKLTPEILTKTAKALLKSSNMTVMATNNCRINRKCDLQNLISNIRNNMK